MKNNSLIRNLVPVLVLLAFAWAFGGCAASAFLGYKMSPDYPKRDENITLDFPGIKEPVEVYFDAAGIAHINAKNEDDLLRAIGFIQASDRFFAMDAMRRIARGRIAELVGEQKFMEGTTIDFDLSMRGWGFDKAADIDVEGLDPKTKSLLQNFADGINYALSVNTPLEYRLLRIEPEPWKLADSFALGRLVSWTITQNWHQETSRLLLALNVGLKRGSKIYGHEAWRGGTTLPAQENTVALPPAVAPELEEVIKGRPYKDWAKEKMAWNGFSNRLAKLSGASNAWVVGNDKSVSGKPIVANDPHLVHFLPSFVYQQHIKTPTIDVIGGTIAGLPYILFGHNHYVSWGTTSACGDVTDLYVEKQNPDKPEEYITEKGSVPYILDPHTILVRDGSEMKEHKFTIRRTIHGPLMNDFYPHILPEWAPPVSIKWNMKGADKSIFALWKANHAKTTKEFREELWEMPIPSSMWLVGDINGDISGFTNGAIPIRPNHLGTFPAPGWLDKYEWSGMLTASQIPFGHSNTGGLFAHGNNLLIDPKHSDVFFQVDSAPSYRLDRIVEKLNEKPKHNWQSMAEIHKDVKILRAERIIPKMLEDLNMVKDFNASETKALEILKNWDFIADVKSSGAVVFFVLYRQSIIGALEDEVDPKSLEFIMSQRYSTNVADLWFDSTSHVVWDHRGTPLEEMRKDVLVPAFKKAVAFMVEQQGPNPDAWEWGKLHDLYTKHFFGSKKALAEYVNLPQIPVGGGLDSVWKSHFDLGHPETPFRAMAGPAYRMIVDLGDIEHSYWVLDSGVSAWPGSPNYGDQRELWAKGLYVPMNSNWQEVKKNAKSLMKLEVKKAE